MSKELLPLHKGSKKPLAIFHLTFLFLTAILGYSGYSVGRYYLRSKSAVDFETSNAKPFCPIMDKVDPMDIIYNKDTLNMLLTNDTFKLEAAKKLSGAIQIPTEVYDNMINPNASEALGELYKLEPLWENFETFFAYLETTFPLVHEHLKIDKVNKFSLVYTWEGKNKTKKPLMLTAHQDVVPVQKETVHQWDFPPFSGHIENGNVHGRGASDCKNLLTGLLDTVELLLSEGQFEPDRTVILAFGYDEESEGTGAWEIARFLLDKYGPDSMYQIIDEGSGGYTSEGGVNYITPATGEKGHLDSVIELFTPGGHSSVPPAHTSIGILSELISLVEKRQFESIITERNPVLHQLQCVAEHSTIDKTLKSDILKAHFDASANANLLDHLTKDLGTKYLVTTSQATDMINGGAKANALPEHVQVLINHRIAVEESVKSTYEKVLVDIKEIATRFDLGFVFQGEELMKPTEKGYFNYTLNGILEPAPVTPMYTNVWNTFGGLLRFLYEDLIYPEDDTTFVFAPFLSTGNTDTKCYWDLTPHIFRYIPSLPGPNRHVHSVNEFVSVESHAVIISFYYYYIQLIDQLD